MGAVAVVVIEVNSAAALKIVGKCVAVEMEKPVFAAPADKVDEQGLGDDICLDGVQRLVSLVPKSIVGGEASSSATEAYGVLAAVVGLVGADGGNISARGNVTLISGFQIQVYGKVATHEDNAALLNAAEIGQNGCESVHAALVVAILAVIHSIRREQRKTAAAAA